MRKGTFGFAVVSALAMAWSADASAATYRWVEWATANVAGGTASGTIPVEGGGAVTVTFAATNANATAGTLYGAQTGGTSSNNYWLPLTTFQSEQVSNAPSLSDILQLSGGQGQIYTVTLSEPIVNPVMSIISLGQAGNPITYDFDAPFTIVSQGPSATYGGSDTALTQEPGDVLRGAEGSGVIQFQGTFSTFSWTVPNPESWHGFTFGILTTKALFDAGVDATTPEPSTPDAATPPAPTFDAGSSELSLTPPGSSDDGCGCLVVGGHDMTSLAPLGTLLAIGVTVARRRKR